MEDDSSRKGPSLLGSSLVPSLPQPEPIWPLRGSVSGVGEEELAALGNKSPVPAGVSKWRRTGSIPSGLNKTRGRAMWPQYRSCEHSGFANVDQASVSSSMRSTRGPWVRFDAVLTAVSGSSRDEQAGDARRSGPRTRNPEGGETVLPLISARSCRSETAFPCVVSSFDAPAGELLPSTTTVGLPEEKTICLA